MANTAGVYSNLTADQNSVSQPSNKLSQMNRTYRVTVVNSTNVAATYIIGGFNRNGDGNAAGSDTGIAITTNCPGGTHGALKREMQNMPSTFAAGRMRVTDTTTFNTSITYQVDRGSQTITNTIEPINSQSPNYNQNNIIDLYEFAGMEWNGTTQISGSCPASATIVYSFNIGTLTDVANAAYGENVVKSTALTPPIQANIAPTTAVIVNSATPAAAGTA